MKKKMLMLILSFIMCFSLTLTPVSVHAGESADKNWPSLVTIGTGTSGGTSYYIGASQSQILTREIDGVTFTAEATDGNLTTNGPLVQNDPDCLGFYVIAALNEGLQGTYPDMEGVVLDKLRMIMVGNATKLQFVTLEGTGITDLEHLQGKKIATGHPGSAVRTAALRILEIMGYQESDFASITPMNASDMADALKDGSIDVGIFYGGTPASPVSDLNSTRDMVMLQLPEAVIEETLEKYPAYATFTVGPETYSDMTEEVTIIGIPMGIGCNADMDADLVYEITKVLNESTDEMAAAHAEGINWNTENSLAFYNGEIVPFHEGAARYYDEVQGK